MTPQGEGERCASGEPRYVIPIYGTRWPPKPKKSEPHSGGSGFIGSYATKFEPDLYRLSELRNKTLKLLNQQVLTALRRRENYLLFPPGCCVLPFFFRNEAPPGADFGETSPRSLDGA